MVKFLSVFITAILTTGLFESPAKGCYAVVVGKKASADGSVLLGHNEQNSGQRFLNFRKVPRIQHEDQETIKLRAGAQIPQVKESYAFLWSENPGLSFSDGYLNEWGVAVVSDGCPDRGQNLRKLEAEGRLVKGGISYLLRRLIIERAKTSKEGVRIAGELIEQVGYPSSRTLVIADPNEAWILSMTRGRHWVAQRVPDDSVVLLPNVFIIRDVNMEDSANFLGSPDLIDYAIKKGWHDPTQGGQFCFCRAYGPEGNNQIDERQRRGQYLVTGKKNEEAELPFCVKPAHKLSVKDLITILRFHGEGELCKESTQEAAVFQLRSNMPADIGCIYWRCSAEPCISALTPWYCGITETPREYYKSVDVKENLTLEYHFSKSPEKFELDDNHAWWVFKKLQDKARADYPSRIEIVRQTWDEFEAEIFENQSSIENKALEMYSNNKSAARKFLTDYSHDVALEAVGRARELTEQLDDN